MIAALSLALLAGAPPAIAQGGCVDREEIMVKAKRATLPRGRWLPEIHARLLELIDQHGAKAKTFDPCRRPLAVFDWDNTVIAGDIGDQAFNTAAERAFFKPDPEILEPLPEDLAGAIKQAWKKETPAAGELRYLYHRAYAALCADKGNAVCYPWIARAFHGHSARELERFAVEVIERELAREIASEEVRGDGDPIQVSRGVRVRPEMQGLLKTLVESGFDVFIVTASPEWLIQTFALEVQLPRENVLGIRTVVDRDGRLTPQIAPPVTYREGKVAAIRTRIAPGGRRPVLAVGDAETDWEMLDEASHLAVLIDRASEGLRAHARARGWAVQPVFESVSQRAPAPTLRR